MGQNIAKINYKYVQNCFKSQFTFYTQLKGKAMNDQWILKMTSSLSIMHFTSLTNSSGLRDSKKYTMKPSWQPPVFN